MSKQRDWAAEYRRRMERGRERGWSKERSRGHIKRASEKARGERLERTPALEGGLKLVRLGSSLTAAARAVGVPKGRLRRYLAEQTLASWDARKRRWRIVDRRMRQVKFPSEGQVKTVEITSFTRASLVMRFTNAVKRFLDSDNASELAPFRGKGVEDVRGRFHPFETDPDALYRLSAADEVHVPEIYALAAA